MTPTALHDAASPAAHALEKVTVASRIASGSGWWRSACSTASCASVAQDPNLDRTAPPRRAQLERRQCRRGSKQDGESASVG